MLRKTAVIIIAAITFTFLLFHPCFAAEKFTVAWSHYTGWEPWEFAGHSGILDKWAKKYNIEIKLVLADDYIESIDLYTKGTYHGCTMTNMDVLTIPAVKGVDSMALILGDFSNGNDGIVVKNGRSVNDLAGRNVRLVELSVSHYLLVRALEKNGLKENQVKLINTPDSKIVSDFTSDENGAVVTWNPQLMQCRNTRRARLVFDSSKIPGEIIDIMVVRSDTPESFKKALTGAWYEAMSVMSSKTNASREALSYMAQFANTTDAEFRAQLRTTSMFYKPSDASVFAGSDQLKRTMEYVRSFCFDHGLYGKAGSKDFVGIMFPDNTVIGDKNNVKLRFDNTYTQLAAEGKL